MCNKTDKIPCFNEICTCGRHLHPHIYANSAPFSGKSEYNVEFIKKNGGRVSSLKPGFNIINSDQPMSKNTTNRVDYVSHPIQRPHYHNPDPYMKPEGDMDSTTNYRREFTDKKGSPATIIKPVTKRGVPAKFDGENTYASSYCKWDMPERQLGRSKDKYVPPKDPFRGIPVYQSDYHAHHLTPTKNFKPENSFLATNIPMSKLTDYRQTFVAHPLPPRYLKKRLEWSKPLAPLEATTTNQRDFTIKKTAPAESCKPLTSCLHSDKPFQSVTTNRTDFVSHNVQKPQLYNPDTYKPMEGDMDMSTSYSRDFLQHPTNKVHAIRPIEAKRYAEPFDDTTDYKENFRAWEQAKRKMMMGPKYNIFPSDPFEGISTTKQHYVSHPIVTTNIIKPTEAALTSQQPMANITSYRSEFQPKCREQCPVTLLKAAEVNEIVSKAECVKAN